MLPGRAVDSTALVTTTTAAGLAAVAAGVSVGWMGAGEAVGAGVAGGAVGVDRGMGVDTGVGALRLQALRPSMAKQAAKRTRVRFISRSFSVGKMPTCLILSPRSVGGR
jgi:hypothetical protein